MSTPINKRDISIILPAYNENAVIRTVVEELVSGGYRVIVVDDGSETPLDSVLENLSVYLLRHEVNLGQGAAIQTGIEFASEKNIQYIITFDGDGQHDAADIEKILQPLVSGKADIVFGSRFMKGAVQDMPAKRKYLLQIARYLNFFFTGLLLTDAHNGLRAMTKNAAAKLNIRENGMAHATELLIQVKKNKLRYAEIPVNIRYTEYSRGKGQTIWSGFRVFFDLLLNKIFK
ncbi:MAG: glycosyltransferase family 2 protein [Chitinophagaceae bacterium]